MVEVATAGLVKPGGFVATVGLVATAGFAATVGLVPTETAGFVAGFVAVETAGLAKVGFFATAGFAGFGETLNVRGGISSW